MSGKIITPKQANPLCSLRMDLFEDGSIKIEEIGFSQVETLPTLIQKINMIRGADTILVGRLISGFQQMEQQIANVNGTKQPGV